MFFDVIVDDVCDDITRQSLQQIHFEEFLIRVVEDGYDGVALAKLVLLRKKSTVKSWLTKTEIIIFLWATRYSVSVLVLLLEPHFVIQNKIPSEV